MSNITCPHCHNPILDEDALLCHFCGESLNRSSSGALGFFHGAGRWLILVMGLIIIGMFVLTFF